MVLCISSELRFSSNCSLKCSFSRSLEPNSDEVFVNIVKYIKQIRFFPSPRRTFLPSSPPLSLKNSYFENTRWRSQRVNTMCRAIRKLAVTIFSGSRWRTSLASKRCFFPFFFLHIIETRKFASRTISVCLKDDPSNLRGDRSHA